MSTNMTLTMELRQAVAIDRGYFRVLDEINRSLSIMQTELRRGKCHIDAADSSGVCVN